jgi:hypothetical protein
MLLSSSVCIGQTVNYEILSNGNIKETRTPAPTVDYFTTAWDTEDELFLLKCALADDKDKLQRIKAQLESDSTRYAQLKNLYEIQLKMKK